MQRNYTRNFVVLILSFTLTLDILMKHLFTGPRPAMFVSGTQNMPFPSRPVKKC